MRIAVLAPSKGLAAEVPLVLERGLKALRLFFQPKEVDLEILQSAKQPFTSFPERAVELHHVFTSGTFQAVFCTVGGDDSIEVLPFLDKERVLTAYERSQREEAFHFPKFFGYSDISQIHLWLAGLRIPSYYGGMVLCQFGMSGEGLLDFTAQGLRRCLAGEKFTLTAANAPQQHVPDYHNWFHTEKQELPPRLASSPVLSIELVTAQGVSKPAAGAEPLASGRLLGGCAECLVQFLPRFGLECSDADVIFFIETSEELPPAQLVRDLLSKAMPQALVPRIAGLLVGIAKVEFLGTMAEQGYRSLQRRTVLESVQAWLASGASPRSSIPVAFDVPFGHLDPQLALPIGGSCSVFPDAVSF